VTSRRYLLTLYSDATEDDLLRFISDYATKAGERLESAETPATHGLHDVRTYLIEIVEVAAELRRRRGPRQAG
jgi:hypothetical protein